MFPKYSCFLPLFYKSFNISDDTDGMQICKTHSEGTAEGGQHQARPVARLQDAVMEGMSLPHSVTLEWDTEKGNFPNSVTERPPEGGDSRSVLKSQGCPHQMMD